MLFSVTETSPREDWTFQAAVNRTRRELQESVERRLLAVAEKAVSNVENAVDEGNLNASLTVLRGVGVLSGVALTFASGDASELEAETTLQRKEAETARFMRAVSGTLTDPPAPESAP